MIKRYNPDCSIHISHEIAFMREVSEGEYVEYVAHQQEVDALRKQVAALASENKRVIDAVTIFSNVTRDITEIICDEIGHDRVAEILGAFNELGNTPATAAAVAQIEAQARIQGINFAASRLCAAYMAGFIDKPVPEVVDVVRMILSAKDEVANNPASEGLSGEYAEKILNEMDAFAAELREAK